MALAALRRKPKDSKAPVSTRELASVGMREARGRLKELAGTVHFLNKRVPLTNNGKEFAALIGLEDLERLRKLDGRGGVVSP